MKKQLLILITLCISFIGYAQNVGDTFVDNFITYEVTSISPNEVEAIDYDITGGTVVSIPATTVNNTQNYNVTSIGNQAFGIKNLTSVDIPNSIIEIGFNAFLFNNLTNVVIPNGVIIIDDFAFSNNNLTTLIIPDNVTSIGEYAFQTNDLISIDIGSGVTNIGSGAFAANSTLTNVTSFATTPPTITTGTSDTFGNRGNIHLHIPSGTTGAYVTDAGALWTGFNSVTEANPLAVGDTFIVDHITYEVTSVSPYTVEAIDYDMAGGTIVDIPTTVAYNNTTSDVTSIGNFAFLNKGLTSITIAPNSITSIGNGAFGNNQISNVIIPNGVTDIGGDAFTTNVLTSIDIADSVTSIGSYAFNENSISDFSNVTLPIGLTSIPEGCFYENSLTNLVIPNSITIIGSDAFAKNQLTSLTISNGVTQIEFGSFKENQLVNITIPESVTFIGEDAFVDNPLANVYSEALVPPIITTGSGDTFGNRSGVDLHIPAGTTGAYVTDAGALWTGFNSVTEDSALAVGDTFVVDFITYEVTSLTPDTVEAIDYDVAGGNQVDIPSTVSSGISTLNVTAIGFSAFMNKGLVDVTIPNSVTSLDNRAFRDNQLTSVTLPNSITIISDEAFINNQLTSVTLGSNVTSIEFAAFQDNNLTSISLPNSLTNIGNQVFYNNNLSSIVFPNGLTNIGGNAFYNNNLTSIVLPSNLTTIYGNTFRNNSLTSITFGDNITTIGTDSFSFNNLTSVNFGNNVTTIGSSAFRNNLLTDVHIPSSVNTINWRAFNNNPLTDVTSASIIPPSVFTGAIVDDSFGDRSNIHLHIPPGTTGAYVTDPGALWTGFNPVTEDALSIDEYDLENNIKVMTNTDGIEVVFPSSLNLKNHAFYTIAGAKVSTGTETVISTSYVSKGVYILKLDFDRGTVTKKIVVY